MDPIKLLSKSKTFRDAHGQPTSALAHLHQRKERITKGVGTLMSSFVAAGKDDTRQLQALGCTLAVS